MLILIPTVSPESSVTIVPNTINSFQGEIQNFTCSAMGGPGNMFSWIKVYDNAIVGDMSNLTVNVNGAADGGQYRCEVSNQAGNDSQVAILNGMSKIRSPMIFVVDCLFAVGPIIDTPPSSVNVSTSDSSTLTCVASGSPIPSIIWVHNGTEVRLIYTAHTNYLNDISVSRG